MNSPTSDVVESIRARTLLELLDVTGNDEALIEALAELGLAISQAAFVPLLERLETAGLIETSRVQIGPVAARVVALTMAGDDVRRGRTERDWIAAPTVSAA
ncbi:hypothetical protein [Sphingomonas sp. Leaf37]|uniref:hypothetical protein n=1 Tax=Sphingomonas sp. Leaf37 TaxID=2876552 RepID=UPI001E40A63D|nr:hypothetical protein [Sphingomonas sp. Leaf37]